MIDVPDEVIVTLPAAGPTIVTSAAAAFVPIVTAYAVALEAELKNTLSADVGADAPPTLAGEPPDVADQFVVDVASHVPAPPTQYLSAI
jgi:hypothetical protein